MKSVQGKSDSKFGNIFEKLKGTVLYNSTLRWKSYIDKVPVLKIMIVLTSFLLDIVKDSLILVQFSISQRGVHRIIQQPTPYIALVSTNLLKIRRCTKIHFRNTELPIFFINYLDIFHHLGINCGSISLEHSTTYQERTKIHFRRK